MAFRYKFLLDVCERARTLPASDSMYQEVLKLGELRFKIIPTNSEVFEE